MHILTSLILLTNLIGKEAFCCSNIKTADEPIYLDACCNQIENSPDPNCNIFGGNCAVCEYHYKADCTFQTRCSCYWCCKYPENCPDGCKDCIYDEEGEESCHGQKGEMTPNRSALNSDQQCGWRIANNHTQRNATHSLPPNLDLLSNAMPTTRKAQEPWLVRITLNRDDDATTGGHGTGMVIGKQWILTAAHLLVNLTAGPLLKNLSALDTRPLEQLRVEVGHNWTDNSQWYTVAEAIPHPNFTFAFNGNFSRIINDIGLIRLTDELDYEKYNYCMKHYFGESKPAITALNWMCLWNENDYDTRVGTGDSGGPAIVCPVQTLCGSVGNAGSSREGMERCAAVGTLTGSTPTQIEGTTQFAARYARVSAYCPWIQNATGAAVHCIDSLLAGSAGN